MNRIIEKMIEDRKGRYCHVVEVNDVYELESIFNSIENEFSEEFSEEEIKEFINNLTVYCLDESNEEEVYKYKF
jgi:hypothetical protein